MYYAGMEISRKRLLLILRILITIAAWITAVVYAHSLAHAYEEELATVLTSPYAKLTAVVIFLTALIYFITLSLPFLPTMGVRGVAATFLWSSLIVFGHSISHEGFHEIEASLIEMRNEMGVAGFMALAAIYAVALAMPFVPGVEIGLLIIALLGATGALIAYLATVGGLTFAYSIGRLMPEEKIKALLLRIGVDVGAGDMESRFRQLVDSHSRNKGLLAKIVSVLTGYRHVTLGVALNFPGNSVFGGGGGLALLSGMSRQFRWRGFVLAVAVATSPLPLLVMGGVIDTQPLLEHHGILHNLMQSLEGFVTHG